MPTYLFKGNENFHAAIEKRLNDADFKKTNIAEEADFAITYCTNMTALEDLYFDEEGLIQEMQSGAIAIDLSPATPSFSKELSAVSTVNDIAFVVAPMFVKNKVADDVFARANMGCFAGAEDDAVKDALTVLEAIFGDVQIMPNIASAQLLRAANTLQNTAEMVAATEVLSLFHACSDAIREIDLDKVVPDATSPEAFFIMKAIKNSNFKGAYNIEMLMGELSAAIMCADDYELIMPQAEAAFHLFELLAVVGGIDLAPSALALVYEGENSEKANDLGLDWHRMESLYANNAEDEDFADFIDGDEDVDSLGGVFDDFDVQDDTESGFGYSVN